MLLLTLQDVHLSLPHALVICRTESRTRSAASLRSIQPSVIVTQSVAGQLNFHIIIWKCQYGYVVFHALVSLWNPPMEISGHPWCNFGWFTDAHFMRIVNYKTKMCNSETDSRHFLAPLCRPILITRWEPSPRVHIFVTQPFTVNSPSICMISWQASPFGWLEPQT